MRTSWVPLKRWKLLVLAIAAIGLPAGAQQPAPANVDDILRQARKEISDFEKAGGKKDAPQHPVGKWVQSLWAVHEKSARTADGAKAATEAVHLLIHADR